MRCEIFYVCSCLQLLGTVHMKSQLSQIFLCVSTSMHLILYKECMRKLLFLRHSMFSLSVGFKYHEVDQVHCYITV